MPKVLIREYDNSTTGLPTSDNFTVVVPGFLGDAGKQYLAEYEEAYKEDSATTKKIPLLVSNGVYEVKTQKDFKDYIGCKGGVLVEDGIAPTLIEIGTDASSTNLYSKYHRNLLISEFNRADAVVHAITELNESDEDFGKNGLLLKTFAWNESVEEKDETGKVIGLNTVERKVTIKLTPVTNITDVRFTIDQKNNVTYTESDKYCLVAKDNKGVKAGKNSVKFDQIGNQIAYELLGLGYTVLYKALSATESLTAQLCSDDFWAPLKDKSVFNFRYVTTGGYYNPEAMSKIIALAKFNNSVKLEEADTLNNECGRGDCIALCDLDEEQFDIKNGISINSLVSNIGTAAKVIDASPYAAIFAPRVTYKKSDTYKATWGNTTFPASFHYLACASKAFEKYAEWYAVAGYNRGISSFDIESTTVKLGEIAINTLAPRVLNNYTNKAINLILHERGNYFLWGNRTAEVLNTNGLLFHHFLNIRQLCTTIKKQLYVACRQFTFDPNSDLLWINFVNAIKPTLEKMRADQGIKGYKITKVANNKKALLTARIRIVPIEAVEDFDISIYLEDSLTGIVVKADETEA